MKTIETDSSGTRSLLQDVTAQRADAFEQLFKRYRSLLEGVVRKRLDRRLLSRVDALDVVQETHVQALKRIDDYLVRRPMPFRLWLIKTACEQIRRVERLHLETAKRAVDRELPLPERSSLQLAMRELSSPSGPMQRRETAARVNSALAELSEQDREIILLRHFEDLSCSEVAVLLEISSEAARKRYRRALLHLQKYLS
jgi:RNA polymerase sigma-70 factor (ECF subfamily)